MLIQDWPKACCAGRCYHHFRCPKIGLCLEPASSYVGELWLGDISLPPVLYKGQETSDHPQWCSARLPVRSLASHKGNFGHVLAVGGGRDDRSHLFGSGRRPQIRGRFGYGSCAQVTAPILEMKTTEIMTRPLPDRNGQYQRGEFGSRSELGEKGFLYSSGPACQNKYSFFRQVFASQLTQPLVLMRCFKYSF